MRGSPPVPSDDLTTLRVSFYVVAQKQLSAEVAGSLADALMKARRDLLGELPILSQMTAPSTDSDAFSRSIPALRRSTTARSRAFWTNGETSSSSRP